MRVLIVGWPSFVDGEATAGDELALRRVRTVLQAAGIGCDTAYSPRFRQDAWHLDGEHRGKMVDPHRYTHLVFACGPLHGEQVRRLHDGFAHCRRIAVGVSVIDPADPAVRGFHRVLARDAPGSRAWPDLSASAVTDRVPVVGVVLAPGQREYGPRRRHGAVHRAVTGWLARQDCARVPLDTRLDPTDWRLCHTPDQFGSLLARLDLVVTTRLHGLVLALREGVPALAIDPIAGGAKVTGQAAAWAWPAVLPAADATPQRLEHWWRWCLSDAGRQAAGGMSGRATAGGDRLATALLAELQSSDQHPVAQPGSAHG